MAVIPAQFFCQEDAADVLELETYDGVISMITLTAVCGGHGTSIYLNLTQVRELAKRLTEWADAQITPAQLLWKDL